MFIVWPTLLPCFPYYDSKFCIMFSFWLKSERLVHSNSVKFKALRQRAQETHLCAGHIFTSVLLYPQSFCPIRREGSFASGWEVAEKSCGLEASLLTQVLSDAVLRAKQLLLLNVGCSCVSLLPPLHWLPGESLSYWAFLTAPISSWHLQAAPQQPLLLTSHFEVSCILMFSKANWMLHFGGNLFSESHY